MVANLCSVCNETKEPLSFHVSLAMAPLTKGVCASNRPQAKGCGYRDDIAELKHKHGDFGGLNYGGIHCIAKREKKGREKGGLCDFVL